MALFGALALHMVGASAATLAVLVVLHHFRGRHECVLKLIQGRIFVESQADNDSLGRVSTVIKLLSAALTYNHIYFA